VGAARRGAEGGGKAWRAFCVFRDLGPERTLRQAAAVFYGCPDGEPKPYQYDRMKRWSAKFDWQERARSLDARDEMVRRVAVEDYMRKHAEDYTAREARIAERILEIREQAAEQRAKMLEWPLTEQRVMRKEDGEGVTYIFMPAKWSKGTAIGLAQLAAGTMAGLAPRREDEAEDEFDLSEITDEELVTYLALDEKIRSSTRKRPE